MAMRGQGVVAIWNDITEEGRANFYEWHNREHMPERLSVPGFLRGRRYIAIDGAPQYFTLYEVRDAGVLSSDAYLTRLNSPTDWTTRSVKEFRNTARSLCCLDATLGAASGGYLGTLRFDCDAQRDAALLERLIGRLLPAVIAAPAMVSAHVGRADVAASTAKTVEQKGRPANAVPRWVVMIEGSDPQSVARAVDSNLSDEALQEPSIAGLHRGVYQLQFDLMAC